ncbi:phage late control D family protein [Clostridium saccharoperbutylacetonicum]
MKVIYEGTEINLEISECIINDILGGKADNIRISFADIDHQCRKWDFSKGDSINIIEEPFSTGIMYIDAFGCSNGAYTIEAISIKKSFKTKKTRTWENVNFLDLSKDLAGDLGLSLETYGVNDFQYSRVDQVQRSNIEFLNYRCMLEGYNLKISDGKALIISEEFFKNQETVLVLEPSLFVGKYNFKCASNHIYGGCEVISNSKTFIKGKYILNELGDVIRITDIPINSISEANRFSENILNFLNKNETVGIFNLNLNTTISAGNVIEIKKLDSFNGKYIIETISYDLISGKSKVSVRKIME